MPYTKVCIHYVWSTKNREPILVQPYRNLLFDHIRKNAFAKEIHIDRLNGHNDHMHCLVWLKPVQSIDTIAKLIKGESAHWFNNRSGFNHKKLYWQNEYYAVSVCESILPQLRAYIDNQENHHQKKSFRQECEEFISKYEFE
jgi:REP element-mobilizing transposase RayT